jgi:hypothetical protein
MESLPLGSLNAGISPGPEGELVERDNHVA